MRFLSALVVMLSILSSTGAEARYSHYYRSVDGSMVHGPTRGNVDYGRVTARCRDGSRSFSHHSQGTCSHHGGVAGWGS